MIIRSVILCYNNITCKLCTVLLSIMNLLVSCYKVTFELNHVKNNRGFSYFYFLCRIQYYLSKPNLTETSFCVRNKQVFSLYRLN